jgi:hypothetical protein
LAAAVTVAACHAGGSEGGKGPQSASTTTDGSPTTAVSSTGSTGTGFVSDTYAYSVSSPAWFGVQANARWDGAGAPSFTDPTVDRLASKSDDRTAFVYATPTRLSLEEFARQARATGKEVRQCPTRLDATKTTTIDGERAIVDETHCPYPAGAFVLTAYAIHDRTAYVFFTFAAKPSEMSMRRQFAAFLQDVSFSTSP